MQQIRQRKYLEIKKNLNYYQQLKYITTTIYIFGKDELVDKIIKRVSIVQVE